MAVRVFIGGFLSVLASWQQIIVFIAILSMVIGAFAAIGQTNIKRLMAYSSIGNVGYALIGLAAGTPDGIQGIIVYMAIYLAMTLGTFAVILGMRRGDTYVETIGDLAGAAQTHPVPGLLPGRHDVLARRHSAARGILRQVLRVRGRHPGEPRHAGGDRRGNQRDRRLLLHPNRQDHVFRSAGERFEELPAGVESVLFACTAVVLLFWILPAPLVSSAGNAARSIFN